MSIHDNSSWAPSFCRSMRYLRPHRRQLAIGLVMAVGVGAFYTFSISSVVPLLKILFSEHEPLIAWLQRVETERRLGITTVADLPDSPDGIRVEALRPDSPARDLLKPGDHIESVGETRGTYALFNAISRNIKVVVHDVRVTDKTGTPRTLPQLTLHPPRAYWLQLEALARRVMPAGADSNSRLACLFAVMIALVVVSILGGVCRFFNEGLVAASVQNAMHDLRTHLGSHVLRLPMDWYSRHPPGDAISRFTTDIAKVEVGLTTLFGKTIREPLKALGVLALTVAIDWRLLVVAAIGFPFGALAMRTFGRGIKKAQKKASSSWGRLVDHLGERLAGIRVVKAYGTEDAETRRFETEDRRLTRAQTKTEYIDAATNPVLEVLAMIVVAGFIMYGGSMVFEKKIEANLFFAAVICLAGTLDPIRKMGNVYNRVQAADASAARLFELIDLPSEEPESSARFDAELQLARHSNFAGDPGDRVNSTKQSTGDRAPSTDYQSDSAAAPPFASNPQHSPIPGSHAPASNDPQSAHHPQSKIQNPKSKITLPPFAHSIRFENVSFSYPANPAARVLNDVSLTVQKGQMTALVGPNGSGKTTLISLLLRFFEPISGRILIDDTDIATVSLSSLRAQIGLVTQDTVIFSDTVRFNVAYGANGVSDSDILAAARMAHADDFIGDIRSTDINPSSSRGSTAPSPALDSLERVRTGYDAMINARSLSGGQRQRISIARAILRNPPILVLDEATSQVDADSERKIQEAMEEVTQGRTTFVIAHRFSTIARADKIVVLDEGRIVGVGRHDELVASCPRYKALYQSQYFVDAT